MQPSLRGTGGDEGVKQGEAREKHPWSEYADLFFINSV